MKEETLQALEKRLTEWREKEDWKKLGKKGTAVYAWREILDVSESAREKSEEDLFNEALDVAAICIRIIEGDWK